MFMYSKPPEQPTNRNKPPMQRPSTSEKSRMYVAGLRQLEDQTLTKKSSASNHPLNQRKGTHDISAG